MDLVDLTRQGPDEDEFAEGHRHADPGLGVGESLLGVGNGALCVGDGRRGAGVRRRLQPFELRRLCDYLRRTRPSALLILVAADVRPAVLRELGRYEGQVLYCTFPGAVREELERALSDEP